jgi:murein L,D-transpeptidase YafK
MKRSISRRLGSMLVLGVPWLSACGMGSGGQPQPAAPPPAHVVAVPPRQDVDPDGFLPWAADEPEMIVVDKTSRTLVLYSYGEPVKAYSVVLGLNPGRKLFEGDRRTPSGLYTITDKRHHSKYDRFMGVSYPNSQDQANYRAARSRGHIPPPNLQRRSSAVAGLGGLIGIHGSNKEELNRLGINWTYGCIALYNRDVEELYDIVPEGTLVLIRDDLQP